MSMSTRVSISELLYSVEVCSILNGGNAATNVLNTSLASANWLSARLPVRKPRSLQI